MVNGAWRTARLLAVALLAGGLLAACGGAAEPAATPTPTTGPSTVAATPTPTPQGAAPAATPTPAGEQPQYGGDYRFVITNPNIGQEPITGTGTGFTQNWGQAYSALLRYRMSPEIPETDYIVAPDLVERWENPNPTTYIFYLDRDARWQDHPKTPKVPGLNGRPFTAQDAIFGIERLRSQGSAQRSYWADLDTVEALDNYTLKLTLIRPSADFLMLVAFGFNKMHAPEAVEAGGGTLRNGPTVGTSAWVVTCEVDIQCFHYRNPTHHLTDDDGNRIPYLDTRTGLVVADVQAVFAAFRSKQVHIHSLVPEQLTIIARNYPQVVVDSYRSFSGKMIHFRQDKAPWSDQRVRMALSKAIDRQEMIDTVLDGKGFLSLAMAMPSDDSYLPYEEYQRAYAQDIPGCKALLSQAGYPNGIDTSMWVANYSEEYIVAIQLLQFQVAECGFRLELFIHDRPTYLTRAFKRDGEFPDLSYGPQGTYFADAWLMAYYRSDGGRNTSYTRDPALDKMIDDQHQELDPGKRATLLRQIQTYLLQKNYQLVVYNNFTQSAVWPWLKNRSWAAGGDYPGYRNADYYWIDKALYAQYK